MTINWPFRKVHLFNIDQLKIYGVREDTKYYQPVFSATSCHTKIHSEMST